MLDFYTTILAIGVLVIPAIAIFILLRQFTRRAIHDPFVSWIAYSFAIAVVLVAVMVIVTVGYGIWYSIIWAFSYLFL